jgi:hypothetical protein
MLLKIARAILDAIRRRHSKLNEALAVDASMNAPPGGRHVSEVYGESAKLRLIEFMRGSGFSIRI